MRTKPNSTLRKVKKSIRSKSGKTFQRSYMIRAQDPKKGMKGRVLASFNHPGPNAGSNHSWLAIMSGALKHIANSSIQHAEFGSQEFAELRRENGAFAASGTRSRVNAWNNSRMVPTSHTLFPRESESSFRSTSRYRGSGLAEAFGVPASDVRRELPRKGYNRGSFE